MARSGRRTSRAVASGGLAAATVAACASGWSENPTPMQVSLCTIAAVLAVVVPLVEARSDAAHFKKTLDWAVTPIVTEVKAI